jgi:hypothetical protein
VGSLKLFVVGQKSANPDEWSALFDRALVIAHDAAEAVELSGLKSGDCAEIDLATPQLLEIVTSNASDWSL